MVKVIKKDGRIEDFSLEKISTSIMNVASDLNVTLSEKDALLLAKDVLNKIISLRGEDSSTSSFEIRQIMTNILEHSGFKNLKNLYNDKCDLKFRK